MNQSNRIQQQLTYRYVSLEHHFDCCSVLSLNPRSSGGFHLQRKNICKTLHLAKIRLQFCIAPQKPTKGDVGLSFKRFHIPAFTSIIPPCVKESKVGNFERPTRHLRVCAEADYSVIRCLSESVSMFLSCHLLSKQSLS